MRRIIALAPLRRTSLALVPLSRDCEFMSRWCKPADVYRRYVQQREKI
eukprot:IDg19100t1